MNWKLASGLALASLTKAQNQTEGGMTEDRFTISPNKTIWQNLNALACNSSAPDSVKNIAMLLSVPTNCTLEAIRILNSTSVGNITFFAPDDAAFKQLKGMENVRPEDLGKCKNVTMGGGGGGGNETTTPVPGYGPDGQQIEGQQLRRPRQQLQCGQRVMGGCNSTAFGLNATARQLLPCLPWILQYHMINQSVMFDNSTFFPSEASAIIGGNSNTSNMSIPFNITVIPTMLNNSCLVHLQGNASSTNTSLPIGGGFASSNQSMPQIGSFDNYQVLIFNATNPMNNQTNMTSGGGSGVGGTSMNSSFPVPFNVSVSHGVYQPANVTIFNIESSNGILHVIDSWLIPPTNLTNTLNATNATDFVNALMGGSSSGGNNTSGMAAQQQQQPIGNSSLLFNLTGVTVFVPDPELVSGNYTSDPSFNVSSYILPQVLYNNFTFIGNSTNMTASSDNATSQMISQNFTMLSGDNVTISFGQNYSLLVNGSQVTRSNVLIDAGVVHFINSTLSANATQGNASMPTTGAASFKLPRNIL